MEKVHSEPQVSVALTFSLDLTIYNAHEEEILFVVWDVMVVHTG